MKKKEKIEKERKWMNRKEKPIEAMCSFTALTKFTMTTRSPMKSHNFITFLKFTHVFSNLINNSCCFTM